jgi:hypothetical protein
MVWWFKSHIPVQKQIVKWFVTETITILMNNSEAGACSVTFFQFIISLILTVATHKYHVNSLLKSVFSRDQQAMHGSMRNVIGCHKIATTNDF